MTQTTLTVPTAFVDISQLAEGLADRADEERLMLYGPEAIPDNTWVRFQVLLADQSAAIEGIGRAIATIDGGEERPEVARFDIVLDSLELEGTGQVVYERILMFRAGAFSGEQVTGELSLDQVEEVEEAAAAAQPPMAADPEPVSTGGWDDTDPPPVSAALAQGGWDGAAEEPVDVVDVADDELYAEPEAMGRAEPQEAHAEDVVDVTSIPPAAAPASPPPAPTGFQLEPLGSNGRALTRPSRDTAWYPEMDVSPDSQPSSGLFAFSGGLPVPAVPPRPDLDPSLRISPAPRPAAGDEGASFARSALGPDTTEEHIIPEYGAVEHTPQITNLPDFDDDGEDSSDDAATRETDLHDVDDLDLVEAPDPDDD